MVINKPQILFVGAFGQTTDGSVGGQLHACNTLVKSAISNEVDFILIDSTMETLPPASLNRRAYLALKRLVSFACKLCTNSVDTVFIFTSSGLSFIEKGCMVIFARIFKVRIVLCPRSGLLVDDIKKIGLMRWYVNFILHRCDVVLCQSDIWKEFYQNLTQLPSSRFAVIKNWLDPLPYFQLPVQRQLANQVNVLFLGWVEKNKGIYELVSAVKKYQELQSNFTFIVCGKGSELENIKNLITHYGLLHCFDFRGWVIGDEKLAVLRNADILVMPSHREGLPNSLLEAMASGCSVIASSVGAIPDVIKNKQNGVLIDKVDIDQLADALLYLSSSPQIRLNMGKRARDTVRDQHDINIVWKNVLALLKYK